MRKLTYVLAALTLLVFSCKDDKESGPSNTDLLTNGSSKSWNVTSESPEDSEEGCRPSSERVKDNTWIFNSDGTFTFDHGTITESGTCGDFVNLSGTWTFKNSEKGLVLIALKNTSTGEIFDDPEPLFDAEIAKLTKDELTLKDPTDNYQMTFSPK